MNRQSIPRPWAALLCLGLAASLVGEATAEDEFKIEEAKWDDEKARLTIKGKGTDDGLTVVVSNANSNVVIGSDEVDDGKWRLRKYGPSSVPCRVAATQSDGQRAERGVEDAPSDCDDGSGTPPIDPPPIDPPIDPPPAGEVSINSTSQNRSPGFAGIAVSEQPLSGDNGYRIFGSNDLGMHCGDFDTRISSILPPFQVLHAQVIQRGGEPSILEPADGVSVVYSAASNAGDPVLSGINSAGTGPVLSSQAIDGTVFKTNFWDIAPGATEPTSLAAYRPFYPPGVLDAFAAAPDQGLPMPNVELFYLGGGPLTVEQQSMPGRQMPYVDNVPQTFTLFTVDQPFFTSFDFGYVSHEVNWFEAAGVPLTAFDDAGKENPWPLYRFQALDNSGAVLASTDVVLPISGEANCGFCHNAPGDEPQGDGGNGAATKALVDAGIPVATAFDDDPEYGISVPLEVSKEYAADLNLIRLHDLKHGSGNPDGAKYSPDLADQTPVVCQTCHYTPALDLAQAGPRGLQNDDPVGSGNPSNGRDQVVNKSMSNVMHSHHATVTGVDGAPLFPDMPPAVDGNGNLRDPVAANQALQETCYQCHPGRRTDCLRGAMASGGMLCQDCHGNMAQVGDDFTRNVQPTLSADGSKGPGKFELASDFYTNPATPRVPWANEPGCGSCHTGDAMDNMHGDADTLGDPEDGIRLMQAFLIDDPKATPIVPTNKRFAENTVADADPGAGNPMLYRVSTGHEGVFCEACHGATHGIWPNKNPLANDNIAALQLQGHTGTISECSTCHTGDLGSNLEGPHGMHPIGTVGRKFAGGDHEELAKNEPDSCRACHGRNGEGTVLSEMKTDRILECDDSTAFCPNGNSVLFPKGHLVGCTECHDNEL